MFRKIIIPFVIACCSLAVLGNEARAQGATISCGQPSQNGNIGVEVVVSDSQGNNKRTIPWEAAILKNDTPEQKARKIRAAFPGDPAIDVGGDANAVKATPKTGFKILGIKVSKDFTGEKSAVNQPTATTACASLGGTASGRSGDGKAGQVTVAMNGAVAEIATQPGMTASELEQRIADLLAAQGLAARLTTEEDDIPFFAGDGQAVLIEDAPDDAGLSIDVKDTGLFLDQGAVFDWLALID